MTRDKEESKVLNLSHIMKSEDVAACVILFETSSSHILYIDTQGFNRLKEEFI